MRQQAEAAHNYYEHKKYILLGKHFYTGNSLILWMKYRSSTHRKVCCVLQMELFCYMQRVLKY